MSESMQILQMIFKQLLKTQSFLAVIGVEKAA